MPLPASSAFVRFPLALLTLGAAGAGQWWLSVDHHPAWSLAAWGVAAVGFLLLLLDPEARQLPARELPLPPAVEWGGFAAVMLVAVFFRTYRLDLIPSGLNHDVAWNGLYAIRILQGEPYTPYVAEAWGRETLMMYLQALGIRLFGPELFAMTVPALIASIALVALCYFWVRELFGPRLALGAAFLLAVSGWSLVFGRIGWRAGLQPVISTVGYLCFIRGLNTGGLAAFALAGAGFAAAEYTYNAARLVPALLPLFVAARLALRPGRREFARRYWRGAVVMAISFLIVVWPMAHYAATHWIQWQGRAYATLFMEGRTLWDNIRTAALLYGVSGNGDDLFVKEPLLEFPAAVLVGFGALWCLLRPRDDRGLFLTAGVLINLIPGLISNPNGNRAIGTLPFAYVFVALGALFFLREFLRVRAIGRPLAALAAAVLLLASGYASYAQYFGAGRRTVFGFYPETTVLGRYMRTLVPDYTIWVGGANFPRDTLTFLSYPGIGHPEERHYTWLDDITELPQIELTPEPGKGLAFIIATIDRGPLIIQEMQRRYPEATVVDLRDWSQGDWVFARALLIPREQTAKRFPGLQKPPAEVQAATVPEADLWHARRGSAAGQLSDPKGIALAPSGDIFVADTGNHRVQRYSAAGALLAVWGIHGALPGQFNEPNSLAADSAGNLHVVDTWNHRVQKLAPDGTAITLYAPPKGFFGPRGIAVRGKRVYVTDGGNNAVAVFDLDGTFQSAFGSTGSHSGQLNQPVGIAVAADTTIWVADSGNNRLQAFAADGTSVRVIPVPGWSGDGIKEAYLAIATGGTLFMTDPIGGTVLRLTAAGALEPIATDLAGPTGIALRRSDVLVTERGLSKVTKASLPAP